MSDNEEEHALLQVAILEILLQEFVDEQGSDYDQRLLLGDAAPPPADLLAALREAERDLGMIRQNRHLSKLLMEVEAVRRNACNLPVQVETRIQRALSSVGTAATQNRASPAADKDTLTVAEAAAILGRSPKTLENRISLAKRAGRDFHWVLRAGRKKGCAVHRQKFMAWLEAQPRRPGRPKTTS